MQRELSPLIERLGDDSRWQEQTLHYRPDIGGGGNCTEAALASLFAVPLAQIPQFHPMRNELEDPSVVGEFWNNFDDWIDAQGYMPVRFDHDPKWPCLYLASGLSSRGCLHMVVYRGGELVHDPHPSNEGIESVEDTWVLIPKDPANLRARQGEG